MKFGLALLPNVPFPRLFGEPLLSSLLAARVSWRWRPTISGWALRIFRPTPEEPAIYGRHPHSSVYRWAGGFPFRRGSSRVGSLLSKEQTFEALFGPLGILHSLRKHRYCRRFLAPTSFGVLQPRSLVVTTSLSLSFHIASTFLHNFLKTFLDIFIYLLFYTFFDAFWVRFPCSFMCAR